MVSIVSLRGVVALIGRFPALAGVDLEVGEGEIVLVQGPNGAGKSTLLRVCSGLMRIESGEAEVLGHDLRVDRAAVRRSVGLLGHDTALYDDLTVEENLRFWAQASRVDEAAVPGALDRLGVAERIREKILLQTRDELPFATAVTVDAWREDEEEDRLIIQASILVEKPGQKKIVIGQKGSRIKEIGRAARLDLQEFLGRRIFLDLFVRQVANWRDDPRRLAELDRQNAFS